jgi:FtsH-binding integral membrane protein
LLDLLFLNTFQPTPERSIVQVATYANPVIYAEESTRAAFLRRVGLLTFVGLSIASFSGIMSAGALFLIPGLLSQTLSFVLIMGSWAIVHFVARPMVYSQTAATRGSGFILGAVFQGVAMGYLLVAAVATSLDLFGNPFVLIGQALGLTGLTAFGMLVYLFTGPKKLSYIGAILPMLGFPLMALMVISFVFPFGGIFGLLLSIGFVGFSAAGLLYQLNNVIHKMPADMPLQAGFEVMIGLLVLFWNILTLLMRLQRR